MPASFIKNPAHWRQRPEEDLQSKDAMLRIAKDYERLAERAKLALSELHASTPAGPGAARPRLGSDGRQHGGWSGRQREPHFAAAHADSENGGRNLPRVNNVNFAVSVGTVVPTSVRVVDVGPELIEI